MKLLNIFEDFFGYFFENDTILVELFFFKCVVNDQTT
jgi:hypothetical protein